MLGLCDARWCFRPGRFPVEGTIWHTCYKHHPTSPRKPPAPGQIMNDFLECHPEFTIVYNKTCDITLGETDQHEVESVFGFCPPLIMDARDDTESA